MAIILIFVCFAANAHAARFIFDADHGESAGNADWVIDADLHNLSWTSAGTFTTSSGNESNAQRILIFPGVGQISLCLWLLVMGVNVAKWQEKAGGWRMQRS